MCEHDWPGNLRELKNTLQRAAIFAEGGEITENLLDLRSAARHSKGRIAGTERPSGRPYHLLSKTAAEELRNILCRAKGNVHELARTLGVTRQALYYHFKRAGIRITEFRAKAR